MAQELFKIYAHDGTEHIMTWANAQDMRRNMGWTMEPTLVIHGRPRGVAEGKTDEAKAKQITVVEIPPPPPVNDPYAGLTREDIAKAAIDGMNIGVDGRWGEKRMIYHIEQALNERLTESGDTLGSDPILNSDSDEEKATKREAADVRRMRAYKLAVESANKEWDEEAPPTIREIYKAFADF